MSQKNKKQLPAKQGELVKMTNGMIDGFMANPSITKLRQLRGLGTEARNKIFRLWETVIGSPEAKALDQSKSELAKEHEKEQEKLPEKDRKPLMLDNPKVQELFLMDSGLEIRKPILSNSKISDEFTPFDMSAVGWIIEFED